MSKRTILPILAAVVVLGGGVWLLKMRSAGKVVDSKQTANTVQSEPKTEEFVMKRAEDYWQTVKFKDYGAAYAILDNKLKKSITKDEYVKRQEWLDSNTLAGASNIATIKVNDATISEETATVRVSIKTNFDEYPGTTKLIYEEGVWHKVFDAYDSILPDLTFEEFTAKNSTK